MARTRIDFRSLTLFEDEESGDTHMAMYATVRDSNGATVGSFKWNNGGNKVNETNTYPLNNDPGSISTIDVELDGFATLTVEGYADDDQDWPTAASNENALGTALIVIDPSDPAEAGQRQLGPTITDNGNQGYVVNLSVDILPATPQPDLSIAGVEVTQAIQHFHSTLGEDNTVLLVESKLTLVRVYLDSGVDPSVNNGQVPGVSGTLTVSGDASFTLPPLASMTAKPLANVDPKVFTDTLNFLIPADRAKGNLTLVAQATAGTNVSNPQEVSIEFFPVHQLQIIMVRVQTALSSAPTRAEYFAAVDRLPIIYPIPTDPRTAISYWIVSGSEQVFANHDLTTESGMKDFLDDLEDIQEDSDDDNKKLYGLITEAANPNRTGYSRRHDNVAFGLPRLMESIGHELGHVYGLDHAPCGNPEDPDDNFKPPDGKVGEVGVDVAGQVALAPTRGDIMSYCADTTQTYEGEWISAYDWDKLFIHFFLGF